MSEVVVQIRGVSKVFTRDSFQLNALHPTDLEIHAGEFFCLGD